MGRQRKKMTDWPGLGSVSGNKFIFLPIDDVDAPSPMSTDGWESGTSPSTIRSYGDRSYSPTTPVHSDWSSGPSTPTSENTPESPG